MILTKLENLLIFFLDPKLKDVAKDVTIEILSNVEPYTINSLSQHFVGKHNHLI